MCLKPPQRRRELGHWLHSLLLKVLDLSWGLVSRQITVLEAIIASMPDLSLALGLMFVPLGTEGWSIEAIKFRLNMYTGPGYLNALLGIVAIMLLVFVFRESKLVQSKGSRKNNIPIKLKVVKEVKQLSVGEYSQGLIDPKESISPWYSVLIALIVFTLPLNVCSS